MAIVVAVFYVVAKLETGFRGWLIFLAGGILLIFALECSRKKECFKFVFPSSSFKKI